MELDGRGRRNDEVYAEREALRFLGGFFLGDEGTCCKVREWIGGKGSTCDWSEVIS